MADDWIAPMRRNLSLIFALFLSPGIFSRAQAASAIQTATPHSIPARSITVPTSTSVVGRLLTNVDAAQTKVGDPIDDLTIEDIKSGHDVLVKKGSILNGHVTFIQPYSTKDSRSAIGILFDRVTLKNGEQVVLNLVIQAIAPQRDVNYDTLDHGNGLSGIERELAADGHTDVTTAKVDSLDHKSAGAYGLPGVGLGSRTEKGATFHSWFRHPVAFD
jgi:hypothetical protein